MAAGGGSLIVKYLQKKTTSRTNPLNKHGECSSRRTFQRCAFAGAGYVFHKLDKSGYEKEMKRHNEAMEKLSEEKEKWYERTVERNNRIAILGQKLLDADKDLDRAYKALHDLRTVTEELEEDKEPTLNEYYEPSDEMKTYMDIVTGAMGFGSGYLLTKFFLFRLRTLQPKNPRRLHFQEDTTSHRDWVISPGSCFEAPEKEPFFALKRR